MGTCYRIDCLTESKRYFQRNEDSDEEDPFADVSSA